MANLLNWRKSTPISIHHKDNPFSAIQRELDRAITEFGNWLDPFSSSSNRYENVSLYPSVDIVEDNDQFKVEAEMPGMGEEDIHVSINDGLLVIKGKKKTSTKNKDKHYVRREISYGSYERTISLPETLDVEKAKASFKKGMLWVSIPKNPDTAKKSKQLKIEKA